MIVAASKQIWQDYSAVKMAPVKSSQCCRGIYPLEYVSLQVVILIGDIVGRLVVYYRDRSVYFHNTQ